MLRDLRGGTEGWEAQDGGDTCVHRADSLGAAETNTALQSSSTPIIILKKICD